MSPSKNAEQGARWEIDIVQSLEALGYNVRRNTERGHADIGGLAHWAIEAKDDASMTLNDMLDQADRQAANEGKPFGVVLKKVRGRPTEESVVMLSYATWINLVRYIEALTEIKESQ